MRLKDTPGLRFTHMLQGNTCLLNAAIFNNNEAAEKRKDYTFRRQFNEKPSIIPGCPGNEAAEILLAHGADPNIGNVSSKPCRPSFVMHVSGTR